MRQYRVSLNNRGFSDDLPFRHSFDLIGLDVYAKTMARPCLKEILQNQNQGLVVEF